MLLSEGRIDLSTWAPRQLKGNEEVDRLVVMSLSPVRRSGAAIVILFNKERGGARSALRPSEILFGARTKKNDYRHANANNGYLRITEPGMISAITSTYRRTRTG